MGTLSKALGSVGGYIAGSRPLIDWLINRARSFIYSTALPPGAIAASHAAVELCQSPDGAALRGRLCGQHRPLSRRIAGPLEARKPIRPAPSSR